MRACSVGDVFLCGTLDRKQLYIVVLGFRKCPTTFELIVDYKILTVRSASPFALLSNGDGTNYCYGESSFFKEAVFDPQWSHLMKRLMRAYEKA